jgi:hypothetical protein
VSSTKRAGWRPVAISLFVLSLGGLGLWLQISSVGSAPLHRPGGNRNLTAALDVRPATSFWVLGTHPEGVPAAISKEVRKRPPAAGLKWRLAQRLPAKLQDPFWVVPGKSALCLLTQDDTKVISVSCEKTASALERGLATVTIKGVPHPEKGGGRVIVGLAPNYARQAVIQTGKIRQTIVLRRHIFVVRDLVGLPPTHVAFR